MRSKLFQVSLVIVCLSLLVQSAAARQASRADDKKYAGTWTGSYSTEEGAGGSLSYTLSKDDKGQWRGNVRFSNQDGEQAADMKSLQIADGKFTATIEPPGGEV